MHSYDRSLRRHRIRPSATAPKQPLVELVNNPLHLQFSTGEQLSLNQSTQVDVYSLIVNVCTVIDYQLKTIIRFIPYVELWKGWCQ